MLPVLRALATSSRLDGGALDPTVVEHALQIGLGPVLAHVSGDTARRASHADRVRAADLTARVLTAEKYAAIATMIAAATATGCHLTLLKGAATAMRYYPSPHLRTMGDVDVLVPGDRQRAFEAQLEAAGFRRRSNASVAQFDGRHHSAPFWHPEHDVWVDVHRSLHPPQHPMGRRGVTSLEAIAPQLVSIDVNGRAALVMNHELQLIYTSTRWLESFDADRGVYPILDIACLLRQAGDSLDWDRILTAVEGLWTATAVRLMLSYLHRWQLATVPPGVLQALAKLDRHANPASIRLLHQLVTRYVMEGRSGIAVTHSHATIIWNTVVRPESHMGNLLGVPYNLAFPPNRPERFSPLYAMRRIRSLTRRVVALFD